MGTESSGEVRLTRNGVEYEGHWSIKNGLITVVLHGVGSDVTQLAGHKQNPGELAAMILSELIEEHLRKGDRQTRSD